MGVGRLIPSRKEWLIVAIVAVLASAVMQIPVCAGHFLARPGTEFTGIVVNIEDFTYQETILQGYDGAWLYHDLFTSEEHARHFYTCSISLWGHIARTIGLSVIGMWHAAGPLHLCCSCW